MNLDRFISRTNQLNRISPLIGQSPFLRKPPSKTKKDIKKLWRSEGWIPQSIEPKPTN
jgi:hypothetical protein